VLCCFASECQGKGTHRGIVELLYSGVVGNAPRFKHSTGRKSMSLLHSRLRNSFREKSVGGAAPLPDHVYDFPTSGGQHGRVIIPMSKAASSSMLAPSCTPHASFPSTGTHREGLVAAAAGSFQCYPIEVTEEAAKAGGVPGHYIRVIHSESKALIRDLHSPVLDLKVRVCFLFRFRRRIRLRRFP
jgi:hypothetical protein